LEEKEEGGAMFLSPEPLEVPPSTNLAGESLTLVNFRSIRAVMLELIKGQSQVPMEEKHPWEMGTLRVLCLQCQD
jgi:hypothetical protein